MASSFDGICSSLLLPITVPTRPQDLNTQYLEKRTGISYSSAISHWHTINFMEHTH